MITKVEVRTPLGMLLTLPLEDISSGYVIADIQGLDPVKAVLVSSNFANLDGAQYQTSRREPRNIVMTLELKPDYINKTVRELRTNLYSFFSPKNEVYLRFFMADGLTVNITGRVESFETALFTQEPKVDISLMCFDPDFQGLTPVVVSHSTVSTLTEFTIDYEGSVPTGFKFVLSVDRSLSAFTIYQRPGDNIIRTFDFASSLVNLDVVTVNSVKGNKYVTLLRTGSESSLLYGKSPQSNWMELQPGENHMRVFATGAAIPYTITYTPRYGGL
jgi:hypothetical protein